MSFSLNESSLSHAPSTTVEMLSTYADKLLADMFERESSKVSLEKPSIRGEVASFLTILLSLGVSWVGFTAKGGNSQFQEWEINQAAERADQQIAE